MKNVTPEMLTTARGLVAGYDPTSGPERTRAFLTDLTNLFTPPTETPVKAKGTSGLMTPTEVAEAFRVDPKTVTRWAQAGKLTSIRTLGGHRRYSRDEVNTLLAGGAR